MGMGDGETLSAAWGLAGGGAAVHLTLPHPGSPRTRDTPAQGAARRVWAALEVDGVHSDVPQGPLLPEPRAVLSAGSWGCAVHPVRLRRLSLQWHVRAVQ